MAVEFLHISDVHLGYRQYNLEERFKDFGRTFMQAVDYAIDKKVDFVLICGDLFNKSALDPLTLLQAVSILERLEKANIKAIAIAGNHDRPSYQENFSWLHYLADRGHLILLRPEYQETGIKFSLYDGQKGCYFKIKGIQIYGIPYLGAAIEPVLEELSKHLSSRKKNEKSFTIVMAHFGLQGEIPRMPGGVSHELIAKLKEQVNYLALGHWHKPFEYDDWIYNPGSLENCSMDERRWKGGFYHVVVEDEPGYKHKATHIQCKHRPFYRLIFNVDQFKTPEKLVVDFDKYLDIEKKKIFEDELAPVIEVSFEGILSFDRASLDFEQLKVLVESHFSPLIAMLKNNTRPTDFEISTEANLPRIQLEHKIIQELFKQNSQYQSHAEQWADLAIEIKNLTLKGDTPDSIVSALRTRVKQMKQKD